jgi:hypothetical protein
VFRKAKPSGKAGFGESVIAIPGRFHIPISAVSGLYQ